MSGRFFYLALFHLHFSPDLATLCNEITAATFNLQWNESTPSDRRGRDREKVEIPRGKSKSRAKFFNLDPFLRLAATSPRPFTFYSRRSLSNTSAPSNPALSSTCGYCIIHVFWSVHKFVNLKYENCFSISLQNILVYKFGFSQFIVVEIFQNRNFD